MDVDQKRVRPSPRKRVKLSPPPPLERLDDDWFDLPAPAPGRESQPEIPSKVS